MPRALRRWRLVLLAALLLPGAAAAAGWRPLAPPDLPPREYAPIRAPPDADHTLDDLAWEVHGSRFGIDLVGRSPGDSMYEYRVRVFHVEEGAARLRPVEARMDCGELGEGRERGSYVGGDGVLVVGVDFLPTRARFPAAPCEVAVRFETYREVGLGAWRTGERTVTLGFTMQGTA